MRAVGRDLTRSRLVAAINRMSSFTADGILSPVDWRLGHTTSPPPSCNAYIQAVGTRFVPVYGTPQSVFTCFETPYPPTTAPITLRTRCRSGATGPNRLAAGSVGRHQFLSYGLPGIPYGCAYARMATGLVLTYRASGVFNLAFGAQAYVSAVVFSVAVGNGWPVWAAFVVAVVSSAPPSDCSWSAFSSATPGRQGRW